MQTGDPIVWRLLYLDGAESTEAGYNVSISEARIGAVEMRVVQTATEQVIASLDLHGWYPIWYRKRRIVFRKGRELVCTVFGRARDHDDRIEAELYAYTPQTGIQTCPQRWLDLPAVEGLVTRWANNMDKDAPIVPASASALIVPRPVLGSS